MARDYQSKSFGIPEQLSSRNSNTGYRQAIISAAIYRVKQKLVQRLNIADGHLLSAAVLSQQLQALRIRAMASSYLAPQRGWGSVQQHGFGLSRHEVRVLGRACSQWSHVPLKLRCIANCKQICCLAC